LKNYHTNISENTDSTVSAETPDGWTVTAANIESLPWHVSPGQVRLDNDGDLIVDRNLVKATIEKVNELLEEFKNCPCRKESVDF